MGSQRVGHSWETNTSFFTWLTPTNTLDSDQLFLLPRIHPLSSQDTIPFLRPLSWHLSSHALNPWVSWEHAKSLQSCPTLCDPMDCSSPGSSVHGILQARILEWVAVPSSRGSSPPRVWTRISYVSCIGRRVLLPRVSPGKPRLHIQFLRQLEMQIWSLRRG